MAKKKIVILMYHKLSQTADDNNYTVSSEVFENQIRYLHDNHFQTLIPEEIPFVPQYKNEKFILITFDDGFETDFTVAYPILKKYGFKGISFVTTSFLGKNNYMSWEQVRKLQEGGFSIQSHTHTHALFGLLDEVSIIQELKFSKALLKQHLGIEATALAIPGGNYSRNIQKLALHNGYKYIFNSKPIINKLASNSINHLLGRIVITQKISLNLFKKIVELDILIYTKSQLQYSAKKIVKKIIGTESYYSIWKQYFK